MELDHELFGKPGDPFEGHHRYQRIKPALALIGCGRSKLYSLIREGRVRAVKIDGMSFIDLRSVSRLFADCPQIVPRQHQHEIKETALGFLQPDAMPDFVLSAADLAGMGFGDSDNPAHESPVTPADHRGPIASTRQRAALAD